MNNEKEKVFGKMKNPEKPISTGIQDTWQKQENKSKAT